MAVDLNLLFVHVHTSGFSPWPASNEHYLTTEVSEYDYQEASWEQIGQKTSSITVWQISLLIGFEWFTLSWQNKSKNPRIRSKGCSP